MGCYQYNYTDVCVKDNLCVLKLEKITRRLILEINKSGQGILSTAIIIQDKRYKNAA